MEQADLVRALQSIDQSDILAHHVVVDSSDEQLDNQLEQQHERQQTHDELPTEIVEEQVSNNAQPQSGKGSRADGEGGEDTQPEEKDLNEWTREQLQAEIVKLRRLAKSSSIPSSTPIPTEQPNHSKPVESTPTINNNESTTSLIDPSLSSTSTTQIIPELPSQAETSTPKRSKRRRTNEDGPKEKKIIKRDEGTGKRVEKDRKTELSKSIRIKIRSYLNVGMDDLLPHPNLNPQPQSQTEVTNQEENSTENDNQNEIENTQNQNTDSTIFVPDWNQSLNNELNVNWINKISTEIYQESLAGLHPKIPNSDLIPSIIDTTTKTAFTNMCKRYLQENDPKGTERREKYTKKRRRWARKDLKQKRRTRTALDPTFQDLNLPPTALRIDYMSSEYSSSGEDTSGENEENLIKRKSQWEEMRRKKQEEEQPILNGKGGWAVGISEKVLEVRTPRWRSEALNDIYKRLDAHALQFSDTRASGASKNSQPPSTSLDNSTNPTNIRPGHVAPSHRRFTMSPGNMRKGTTPRELGEGWMWASGMGGVWPEEAARWIGDSTFDHAKDAAGEHPQDLTEVLESSRQDSIMGSDVSVGVGVGMEESIEGGNEMEAARLGLVNALEGL